MGRRTIIGIAPSKDAVGGWIALECWIWGFNPVGNFYFVLGLVEAISAGISLHGNR